MDFKNDIRFRGIRPFEKKLWLSSPTIHGEEQRWVDEAIRTNWVSTIGANINEIEKNIAQYVGCRYAVALSSGTAALHVATKLAGEKLYGMARPNHGTLEGKKVFCSDVTFSASINPVAYEDGEAVFIDTEPDTWNMSPEALEKAFQIYPEVRLIVVAHLYGTPGKVAEIRRIADAHGALIVEDAAESLGARYFLPMDLCTDRDERAEAGNVNGVDGWWVETGALGDYNCISFNGNKIITGSSGGMFLTDSLEDCNKVKKWSTQSREDAPWYQHEEIGYNYRMSNIVAGIVRGQLPYLDMHIDQKRAIYERYKAGFRGLPVTMNPFDASVSEPNYWLSCLLINSDAMAPHVRGEKDQLWQHESGKSSPGEILAAMAAFNAEGRPIWKPMHMQPIYRSNPFITAEGNGRARSNAYISGKGQDVGEDLYRRGLCLPSDNKMTAEQQKIIIDIIHRCFC
ncbi:MAG: DegT/DnrJ/EryC1/StrS family aminotransferase [Clostridia bacterium]|nr:DegT/DnrJ/EryC1/StrS family aminotransferase [Clostridia bacterium]MBR4502300.1 DegT/DnrJ/EryC1/StrS family aminotransferase [Clostridia bacterium]